MKRAWSLTISACVTLAAGGFGAWLASAQRWEPRYFCASGDARLDAGLARAFILQYLTAQNRFARYPWVPLEELRAWEAADFQPIDVIWPEDGLSWDFTVETAIGLRRVGLWADADCRYSISVSALEKANKVAP